jgi:F-type H+-transporting ATPase subunit b
MLIDWFTVAAQALNFLILVWLLKRFLYQPVLNAVNAREQRIAKQLAEAAAKEAAASKEREEFARKNAEFDAQRAALLDQASEQAKAELQRLLEQARKEADALRSRLQDALRNEREILSGEIRRRTCDEVFAIARKALADLATAELEASMARVFIGRLAALSVTDRKALAAAIAAAPGTAVVRSAFELPPAQRTAIEQALAAIGVIAPRLSYETVPGLISGVQLSAGGHKLAWSIADYLGELEQSIGAILAAQAVPETAPAPAPAPAPAVPKPAPAAAQ